ncbi:MAG: nucleotidyltransferase domain-containing protein [Cytophagales bacterium]
MELGINNHLRKIASELFIKFGSSERKMIDNSVQSIVSNLESYFEDEIEDVIVFGSYTRDTILPRDYDSNSDIDILVQFSSEYDRLKPESYRNQLKKFAEKFYKTGSVIKDHPSIVIELNHINFDLVPAIFDEGIFYDSIEIPGKESDWIETDPAKFNEELTNANTKYASIVKPIVRLLKYWNASQGYPYSSYELETMIADMNFSNDNYQSGFLYAIKELSTWDLSNYASKKVDTLKSNAKWIKEYLDREDLDKAKEVVSRILPGF